METITLTVTLATDGLTPEQMHALAIDTLAQEFAVTDDHGIAGAK